MNSWLLITFEITSSEINVALSSSTWVRSLSALVTNWCKVDLTVATLAVEESNSFKWNALDTQVTPNWHPIDTQVSNRPGLLYISAPGGANEVCILPKNKVNRCLARYSPHATTTNRPTNRAPNKPAWPSPNWPKMPILGQFGRFWAKNPFLY